VQTIDGRTGAGEAPTETRKRPGIIGIPGLWLLPRLDLNQRPSDYVEPLVKGGSFGRYLRLVGYEVAV
jgi:hypothetical protein